MEQTAVKHQCKHGCGYEHAKRGPMNLHELYHCKKLKAQEKQGEDDGEMKKTKEEKPKQQPTLKCDCGTPDLAFMNKRDPKFAGALEAGYKRICQGCGEVFK